MNLLCVRVTSSGVTCLHVGPYACRNSAVLFSKRAMSRNNTAFCCPVQGWVYRPDSSHGENSGLQNHQKDGDVAKEGFHHFPVNNAEQSHSKLWEQYKVMVFVLWRSLRISGRCFFLFSSLNYYISLLWERWLSDCQRYLKTDTEGIIFVCVCVCCGPNLPIVCFQISPLSMSIVTEGQLAKNLFALGRKKKPLYCMWKRQR